MNQLVLDLPPVKGELFYGLSGHTTCAVCNKVILQQDAVLEDDEHFCSEDCKSLHEVQK